MARPSWSDRRLHLVLRSRSARRRLVLEQLESRQAPGSLIPIPLSMPLLAHSTLAVPSNIAQSSNARSAHQRNLGSISAATQGSATVQGSRPPQAVASVNQTASWKSLGGHIATQHPAQSSSPFLHPLTPELDLHRTLRDYFKQFVAPKLSPHAADVRPVALLAGASGSGSGGSGSGVSSHEPRSLDSSSRFESTKPDMSGGGSEPSTSDARPTGNIGPNALASPIDTVSTPTTEAAAPTSNSATIAAKPNPSGSEKRPPTPDLPVRSDPGQIFVLNTIPQSEWRFIEHGGRGDDTGRLTGPLRVIEGNSFLSQLEVDWQLPQGVDRIQFQFRVHWDTDSNSIRDAFEASWLDANNKSLLPTIASGRDSFFNFTEGLEPKHGTTTTMQVSPLGSTWIGTVTADVSSLPVGTTGTFQFRLINNDNAARNDNTSYVRLDLTNTAPESRDDEYTTGEDRTLTIASPGILSNDADSDDDPLQAILVAHPEHGTLTLERDGSLVYVPQRNFSGIDRFQYLATDGTNNSAPSNVVLHVSPINDAPTALDDHYSIGVGNTLTRDAASGLLANDFDSENDSLTAFQVNGNGLGPAHGQVTVHPDGSFTYVADPNWTGDDFFTYRTSDGALLSDPARVDIRIVPGIAGIFVDSTRWGATFPFSSSGYSIAPQTRHLPWFNVNQVRIHFTEPIAPILRSDFVVHGSPTLGIDYETNVQFAQPDAKTLELTLAGTQSFLSDKILIGLLETIHDLDGNAIDGDGDGAGGDPANIRFTVSRGDVDNSGIVLSNDVTLVRNSQLGLGTYDPFRDVNGSGLILSDDVTLTRNNQLGLPGSDRILSALALPTSILATSRSAKFFVVDANQKTYRYRPDGSELTSAGYQATSPAKGIAMTADGATTWLIGSDHTVSVYETTTGYRYGAWTAGSGSHAEGISVFGNDVWTVDSSSDRIRRFSNAVNRTSGSVEPDDEFSLAAGNTDPTGLVTDGIHVWVSDALADRVFVYASDGALVGSWPLDDANREPSGITLDPSGGDTLWVVDRSNRRVFTYRGGRTWSGWSEPASDSFELSPSQTQPEDIADPPPAEPLSVFPVEPTYGTTSFANADSIMYVDLQLSHHGTYSLRSPLWLGVRNLSRADIRLLDADGYADGQIPYVDLADVIHSESFEPESTTTTIGLRFHNPSREPFTYELVLFPKVNAPPEITSTPVYYARPDGASYRYDARAVDPNNDTPLRYELLESPDGMTIDPQTGSITWTTRPGAESIGTHRVALRVLDPFGLSDTQQFSIEVLGLDAGNRPPVWISEPVVSAHVQTEYQYFSQGRDVDGDALMYSILTGPEGMTIDPSSGIVLWKPTDAQLGVHSVVLRVRDDASPSLWSDQEFAIRVSKQPGNNDPKIVSNPSSIYNVVTPNPASGPVSPTEPILISLNDGQTSRHTVTYTRQASLPQADVLFLLDDTASVDNWGSSSRPGSISLLNTFMQSIENLDAAYPDTDFAFGVARVENFALSDPRSSLNRPFVLNQPLLRKEDAGFERFLQNALTRRAPGVGAGTVAIFEALYQAATGVGMDYGSDTGSGEVGPVNGTNLDYGHSLDIAGQTRPGASGDVSEFNTPRDFAYRILKTSDFPRLQLDPTREPVHVSGVLNQPRIATGWRFSVSEDASRFRIATESNLADSEWIVFDPSGVRLYSGDSNDDVELQLGVAGEYTVVLNSLANVPISYAASFEIRSDRQPLVLNQEQSGNLRFQQQVDRYRLLVEHWSSVYLDAMTSSPGVSWRLIAPDRELRAEDKFSTINGNGAVRSGDALLGLAPGEYTLEVAAADSASVPSNGLYRFALRTDPQSTADPVLSLNGTLDLQYQSDRASAAQIHSFRTEVASQRVSISVPDPSTSPNVRQLVLDEQGKVLHRSSTYADEVDHSYANPFVIEAPGRYFVLFDGNILQDNQPYTRSITLRSLGTIAPPATTPIAPQFPIAGTVTSASNADFEIEVPSGSSGKSYFFDPLTIVSNIAWTLRAPSGAIVARSRMDGSLISENDLLPRLSQRAVHLAAGSYRLSLTYLGNSGPGQSANFRFRFLDIDTLPITTGGDILVTANDAVGSKLIRIDRSLATEVLFLSGGDTLPNRWRLYAPDHSLRFDLPNASDAGMRATHWDASDVGDYLLDFGSPGQPIGTRLATLIPHRIVSHTLADWQMSEAVFITSQHPNLGVENEYQFELRNPARFYFEPRPSDRQADADWSLVGPGGTLINQLAFSDSASAAPLEESNAPWLREGKYRLVIRSRQGDVDFRFVDLFRAGLELTDRLIDGSAGPNPEGTRFYTFDGRQGDWHRIRFTEPNDGGSSGLLRVRVIDSFGRWVSTRFVPGPVNSTPSPGFVDIDLDLPATGRYSVLVEDPLEGNLRRPFTVQRSHRSSFPESVTTPLVAGGDHHVDVDSSRLLYDGTIATTNTDRWLIDGLHATGDYPTHVIVNGNVGGRNLNSTTIESDVFQFSSTADLLVQTYTKSVPTTTGTVRGGAGFRPTSVPIIVFATDTWSDVTPVLRRGATQPTDIYGYGESHLPQDHLSGAYLNPEANPGSANSFLFPDSNSVQGQLRYRTLNVGGPPNTWIVEDRNMRSTEATIQQTVDALLDLGAYVLPVFMDQTSRFDDPQELALHQSWYDLPLALARLSGTMNASDSWLATGDEQFPIAPNQPLTFFIDGYNSTQQATQLTNAVSQFLQFGRLDVDVVSSDPSVVVHTSGPVEYLSPGQTASFEIDITGDGTNRTFDLLFVRKGTGNIVGSIPVQIQQPYRYDADAIDPDEDPLTYALVGESHGAAIDVHTGAISWSPAQPGSTAFTISVSDGRGGRDQQTWTIVAGPDLAILNNHDPRIEPIPDQTATIGNPFAFQTIAHDDDADPLFYFLQAANPRSTVPDGLTIDRHTGEIAWKPNAATSGWVSVRVGVRDARGAIVTTPMKIRAIQPQVDPNSPPIIQPIPDLSVIAGDTLSHRITAFDPQHDRIQFRLSLGTERGAVLDPATDTFFWTPTEEQLGIHEMIVAASDSFGAVSLRKFRVIVQAPNRAPIFRDHPVPGPTNVDRDYIFFPSAYDPDEDAITYESDPANPEGLTVDPTTGIVRWKPRRDQTGTYNLAIDASDNRGGRTSFNWTLVVLLDPSPNRLPIFLTEPRTVIRPGFPWTYRFDTFDPDGDLVTYSVDIPNILDYDESSHLMAWASATDGVAPTIRIVASDGQAVTEQRFQLTVSALEPNHPPTITSFPMTRVANVEKVWRYDVNAVDLENDPISYSFAKEPPRGMSIDRDTGAIYWIPKLDLVRDHAITISATDIYGASGYQSFIVRATALDLPPVIDSDPIISVASPGDYQYTVLASDPEDQPLRYRLMQGPQNASMTSQGQIHWHVPEGVLDAQLFEISVDTGPGSAAVRQRWFVIPDASGRNQPPRIDSIPTLVAGVGNTYSYRVQASDHDDPFDAIRYSLIASPRVVDVPDASPMTIDTITGQIQWTPVQGHLDPGAELVEVAAESNGSVAHQRFRIRVLPTNREPVVAPWVNPQTIVGQVATIDLDVRDPDADPIRFELVNAPQGMFVDVHGRLRWATSTNTPVGHYAFSILATDDRGEPELPRDAWVDVIADTIAPVVVVSSFPSPTRTTYTTALVVDAIDISGITQRELSYRRWIDGELSGPSISIPVNASGIGEYQFPDPGYYRLFGSARDGFGNVGISEMDLAVGDGSNAPRVSIIDPISDATIDAPIEVFGSILDSDLQRWSLTVTDLQGTQLKTIATGTTQRDTGSPLGILDTTLLPSESLLLVLTGTDILGQSSSTSVQLNVVGALKLGNLKLTFSDLIIPVTGIPITIQRTYDTLRAQQLGDFGYGWYLDFQQSKISIQSETLGNEGTTRYAPFVDGTRVLVTLPDGTSEGFTFQPRLRAAVPVSGDPLLWLPYFKPDEGNTSSLGVPQSELNRQGGGSVYRVGSLPNNDSYSPVDPAIAGYFVLQTADGLRHFIDARTNETTKIVDRNGNEVLLTEDGLISNRGRSVLFERNHRGLITRITDPRGNALSYTYDAADRLDSFQDRNQNDRRLSGSEDVRTRFTYRSEPDYRNYLDTIVDPNQVAAVKPKYDLDTGRLFGLQDAYGNTAHYTYTLEPASQGNSTGIYEVHAYAPGQLPSDPQAQKSTMRFNDRGLPIASAEPSGQKIAMQYDSPLPAPTESRVIIGSDDRTSSEHDDLVTKTDFGFSVTSFNAVVSRTIDPQGNVTERTYNKSGQLTAETDASGNTTRFLYDKKAELDSSFGLPSLGNVKYVLDSNGNRTDIIRDTTTGLPIRVRNQLRGSETVSESQLTYNATGDLVRLVDSDGKEKRVEYDGNGNGRSTTHVWTDPMNPLTTQVVGAFNVLDANDKKTRVENRIDGTTQSSSTLAYDSLGRPLHNLDANGQKSETRYDKRGSVIETRTETLQSEFNPSTQQMERIWNASRSVYDEQGRQVLNASGIQVFASGQLLTDVANIAGTQQLYNAKGQLIESRDLLSVDIRIDGGPGNWTSSLANTPRVVSRSVSSFDANDRPTESVDAFGKVSHTYYDRFGNVVESRSQAQDEHGNALWLVTRTVFDTLGRNVASTDPYLVPADTPLGKSAGNSPPVFATFTEYDDRGRTVKSVRRSDTIVGWTNDADRVLSGIVSPGNTLTETRTEYDVNGRAYRQIAADGQESITLYDSRGRTIGTLGHAVAPSLVGLTGDFYANKRVRSRSEREYDDNGQVHRSLTNIIQIEDSQGNVIGLDRSQQRVTSHVHDAKGQLLSTTHPNGAVTQQEYDLLGRVVAEIDPFGNRKSMAYDKQGRMIELQLPAVPNPLDSNALTRPTYRYEYDSQGQMTALIDANGNTTRFEFNDRGQQTSRTLPLGQSEFFQYDNRNREILHVTFEGVHKRTIYDDSAIGGGRVLLYEWFANARDFAAMVGSGSLANGVRWKQASMTYDALGRLTETKHIDADGASSGNPSAIVSSGTWRTEYDRQGRVIQENTPNGVLGYEYDVHGRKVKTWASSPGGSASEAISEVTYGYNEMGLLASVNTVRRDGTIVDTNTLDQDVTPESTRYHYDIFGRYEMTELPNELVETYAFDAMDRIQQMQLYRADDNNLDLSDNARLSRFSYTYRADGKQSRMTESFGTTLPLDQSFEWTYDSAGRLIREVLDSSNDTLDQVETYVMDLVGNRVARGVDKLDSSNDTYDVYKYDANDRLLAEDRYSGTFASGSAIRSTHYAWNATQQIGKSITTPSVTLSNASMRYGLSGQLEGMITEAADGAGNVIGRTQVEYRYDAQGLRYLSIESVDGNVSTVDFDRIETGRTEFLIDPANFTGYGQSILETVRNASGQAIRRTSFTFGKDALTETTTLPLPDSSGWSEGVTRTIGHDGKGSTRALLEAGGVLAQIFTYSAYGDLLAIHNASGNRVGGSSSSLANPTIALTSHLYNAERLDTATGQYNLRTRWYDPSIGRFDRLDPFAGNPNDPFSFNKYSFVHGNPISGSDPSGMWFSMSGMMASMAIGGAVVGGMMGGFIATYSGSNVLLGIATGAAIGAMVGAGLVYGASAMIGYFGGFYSTILASVGGEHGLILFLVAYSDQERRQKGPGPSPERARHDFDYALMSLAVYDQDQALSQRVEDAGWTFSLQLDDFANNGFSYHSRIYTNHARREMVMAYEGTANLADWANNAEQGTGMSFEGYQYQRAKSDGALAIARAKARNYSIRFVGHSLGGGLAAATAMEHSERATTFNAAGVNRFTTSHVLAAQLITNYRVRGEILSTLQDMIFIGWFLPDSSPGTTYWLRSRSGDPIQRHSNDILPGIQDFF